jgi:hypothetical protein
MDLKRVFCSIAPGMPIPPDELDAGIWLVSASRDPRVGALMDASRQIGADLANNQFSLDEAMAAIYNFGSLSHLQLQFPIAEPDGSQPS